MLKVLLPPVMVVVLSCVVSGLVNRR